LTGKIMENLTANVKPIKPSTRLPFMEEICGQMGAGIKSTKPCHDNCKEVFYARN